MPAAGSGYRSVWKAAGDERSEARSERRKVECSWSQRPKPLKKLEQSAAETNPILHVTC
jgi:hypothetical protein